MIRVPGMDLATAIEMVSRRNDSKLIYTTDPVEARKLREAGSMPSASDVPPAEQTIRIVLDRKRRRGKTVTVASGFQLSSASLKALGSELRKRCGSGGSAADGEIEVQGDHSETLRGILVSKGFRIRS